VSAPAITVVLLLVVVVMIAIMVLESESPPIEGSPDAMGDRPDERREGLDSEEVLPDQDQEIEKPGPVDFAAVDESPDADPTQKGE
jgi:hypothetical protein